MLAAAPRPYDSLGLTRFADDAQRLQNVITIPKCWSISDCCLTSTRYWFTASSCHHQLTNMQTDER